MVATRLAARNDVQSAPEIRRLLGRLGPEDPMMDHALRALGVLGDAAAVPDLKRVATNPAAYYSNVQAAIRAMAAIGTAEASAALDEMAGDPKLARWVEEARGARL
jgi:HEAT repeat protein